MVMSAPIDGSVSENRHVASPPAALPLRYGRATPLYYGRAMPLRSFLSLYPNHHFAD